MIATILPVIVVVAIVGVAGALLLVSRSRRSRDGVDSFRRQIDALSPEARRPVVDQVHNAAGRTEPPADEPGAVPTGAVPTDTAADDTADGSGADGGDPTDGPTDTPGGAHGA